MVKTINDYLKLNVYQIYPKSFKDDDGDGIGDLRGIISKLDYLKDLGINAIWICPIYASPQDDNGYDISNYLEIDPMYGTMDDFKELVEQMHKRGIKLIMDFVANHTSTHHKWFIESSKSKNNQYSDYYYWQDKPNGFKSVFGGNAWEYSNSRDQYYLHSFAITQADLNWENKKVREEMKNIIKYWINLGVDGFRCDVIDLISKDIKNNIFGNGPKLHQYIKELFGDLNIFTVGECGSNNIDDIKNKCSFERSELTTLFQFDHLDVSRKTKFIEGEAKLYKYRDALSKWCQLFQDNNLIYTLFTDNHDQPYMINRLGSKDFYYESSTCIASMTYLLRGIPFIYQGIEFGSMNSNYGTIDDFDDLETINYYNERIKEVSKEEVIKEINFGSRDNPRHPMAWDSNENYGFSEAKPWIKFANNSISLESDLKKEKSIYRYYASILKLRNNYEAFSVGYFKDLSIDNTKFVFERYFKKEKFIVICNYENNSSICLNDFNIKNYEVILSNYNKTTLTKELSPYEVMVIKIIE